MRSPWRGLLSLSCISHHCTSEMSKTGRGNGQESGPAHSPTPYEYSTRPQVSPGCLQSTERNGPGTQGARRSLPRLPECALPLCLCKNLLSVTQACLQIPSRVGDRNLDPPPPHGRAGWLAPAGALEGEGGLQRPTAGELGFPKSAGTATGRESHQHAGLPLRPCGD